MVGRQALLDIVREAGRDHESVRVNPDARVTWREQIVTVLRETYRNLREHRSPVELLTFGPPVTSWLVEGQQAHQVRPRSGRLEAARAQRAEELGGHVAELAARDPPDLAAHPDAWVRPLPDDVLERGLRASSRQSPSRSI